MLKFLTRIKNLTIEINVYQLCLSMFNTRGGHSPRFSNLRAAEKVKQVKHLKI